MDPNILKVIQRCQDSPIYFIENFCKVKHPKAGVIPFHLWKYQMDSVLAFLKYRYNIYRKCRQSGISTLAGSFALWYAMFFAHKTVLIVSKRDEDAKEFLRKNVKLVYENLPVFMRKIWGNLPETYNEHMIVFPNGSYIKSLTSSKDTLRSNSSSLNIIDESGYMPDMDDMWAGGQQTLVHGGSVIVISTSNGVGNWYNITWEEAEAGRNPFHPIHINWWDMNWAIEYVDELTGQKCRISPVDGIKECKTKEEKDKWGQYWSPWLQEQFNALQQRGEAHLFRQEVLTEFIGAGNTVLDRTQLLAVKETVDDNFSTIDVVDYVHPVSGEKLVLNFEHQLRIWKKPVRPTPDIVEHGRVIKKGNPGHTYSLGVDISSGEADDYSAIVVLDATTLEQVAELNIKVLPQVLTMMVDYIGRWYNGALVVPERAGLGIPICQGIYTEVAYANVYRMKTNNGTPSKKVGYPTSPAHKPALIKCLLDYIGPDGVTLVSRRLYGQLCIFIHTGNKQTGNVKGPGNYDDLTIATALALVGVPEAVQADQSSLVPTRTLDEEEHEPVLNRGDMDEIVTSGGLQCISPLIIGADVHAAGPSPSEELANFQAQLGGIPMQSKRANPVVGRKNAFAPKILRYFNR